VGISLPEAVSEAAEEVKAGPIICRERIICRGRSLRQIGSGC
jgi:hypothetical protein